MASVMAIAINHFTSIGPEQLARALDSLATCVIVIDDRGAVLHFNAAAETLLGASRNQARGRALSDLFRGGETLSALIERAAETQRPYSKREMPLRFASTDQESIVDITVSPADDLTPTGALLIEIDDATQHLRIARENALLAQVDGNRLMIRQLAHEIKNPLGGLRGAAQLLERQLTDASMREYTSIIISEADRLKTLVDALLGPGHAPRKQTINAHEIMQHVWQLLQLEAPTAIKIERDYDPSLPPLMLDRDQIVQVMLNLGRNALQALTQSGATGGQLILRTRALFNVYIGARRHRLVASVQFEDDGPGVPEHLRDSLFFPLVTGRADGAGLGLAVAQDLTSRHDGLIEFESRPGRTIFTVLLPIQDADANETA